MDTRDRIRWIFVFLVGVVLVTGSESDGWIYAGAFVIFLSLLGAWWHSELLRRKREADEDGES